MAVQIVILAAGTGKRMCSPLPKVLHQLAGKSLVEHVIATSIKVANDKPPLVVHGYQGQLLRERLKHLNVRWIEQRDQLGTAHAVQQTLAAIADDDHVLILYGDVPLISVDTLHKLIDYTKANHLGMVSTHLADPSGYGRIKRDQQQQVVAIVEDKDANQLEKQITEINPGIYFVAAKYLKKWLTKINNANGQREYYLTDMIALAKADNIPIQTITPLNSEEVLGVNDRLQLAYLERFHQRQLAEKLMRAGVTIYDPARIDIRGELTVGTDTIIDINLISEGQVIIGRECIIGPNVILRNTIIGDRCEIRANSVIENAEIESNCTIGPFARVRPGTTISANAHIGNFVEVKNSIIGFGSKVNHLSYIGDSEIGEHVNIGAGTITCNFDGINKHRTKIGDYVFIGSDTQLVAPVSIGEGATIGAGSTITQNVPANTLTLTQNLNQRSIEHWRRPEKTTKS